MQNSPSKDIIKANFCQFILIEEVLLTQSPQFASNIPRFGEELDKLTKMLPEANSTILMSGHSHTTFNNLSPLVTDYKIV